MQAYVDFWPLSVLDARCMFDTRMFSRVRHPLGVFPRLALPRMAPVVCFPALDTRCVFSRAWHLYVFARFTLIVYVFVMIGQF